MGRISGLEVTDSTACRMPQKSGGTWVEYRSRICRTCQPWEKTAQGALHIDLADALHTSIILSTWSCEVPIYLISVIHLTTVGCLLSLLRPEDAIMIQEYPRQNPFVPDPMIHIL